MMKKLPPPLGNGDTLTVHFVITFSEDGLNKADAWFLDEEDEMKPWHHLGDKADPSSSG